MLKTVSRSLFLFCFWSYRNKVSGLTVNILDKNPCRLVSNSSPDQNVKGDMLPCCASYFLIAHLDTVGEETPMFE